jgi:hypothetical protein
MRLLKKAGQLRLPKVLTRRDEGSSTVAGPSVRLANDAVEKQEPQLIPGGPLCIVYLVDF